MTLLEETNALGVMSATAGLPVRPAGLKHPPALGPYHLIPFELVLQVTVGGGVQSPVLSE